MPLSSHKTAGKILPLLIVGIVLLIGGAVYFLTKGSAFSNLEPLPAEQYLNKPADFLGNDYAIRAQIDSQINWQKGLGRILAVTPEGSSMRLPVFVPESVGGNIHIGQRFEMRVRIEEGGLIYVEALRKY